jgi:hypothetical protein
MGRATQGVRLMDLGEGERLVAMARLAESDSEGGGHGGDSDAGEEPGEPAPEDEAGAADEPAS